MAYYPPCSFFFTLGFSGIQGDTDAAFQEVSGMNADMDIEEVICGGENRFKYRLPGSAKYTNLILKRGLITSGSELAKWCTSTISGGLIDVISPKTITVKLLNSKREVLMSWDFMSAYPIKWGVSEFKSMENAYAVETLEFAYTYFKQNT